MSTPIERLLLALEAKTGHRARRSGKGWRVCCPVCGTASLKGALIETDNGSVLAHWFCGHSIGEALDVLGLTLADLYERRDLRSLKREERAANREHAKQAQWRAALAVLSHETGVVLAAVNKLGDGATLSDEEVQRIRLAALRVFDAGEVLHV